MSQRILVTGNAGFIGFHVARALLARGDSVVGLDSVNSYYDVGLKQARLAVLLKESTPDRYQFIRANLADRSAIEDCFNTHTFDRVIHLAAQAGVRHSIHHPHDYMESNLVGFLNILEACRHHRIAHLTYASSSSVYGSNASLPFSEHQGVDHPLHLYAASKRANELMAHAYSHLFALPTTGLRFFTVYGPWGRPDMALFLFTRSILAGEPIALFNHGNHTRDFTYVDDIVEGVLRASDQIAAPARDWNPRSADPATSDAPFRVYNIGNNRPVELIQYVNLLEQALGKKATLQMLPRQAGDIPDTHADITLLQEAVGYAPKTTVEVGVRRFVTWYRDYYDSTAA